MTIAESLFTICSEMTDAAAALMEASADPDATGRRQRMLDRLAEAGLEIAIALETRAKAAAEAPIDDPVDLDAVALAYSRVARAVRMTVLLQSKLIDERDAATDRCARAERSDLWQREAFEQERAARILRRVIAAEHHDVDRIERLCAEVAERVEDDDLYGAALGRPLSDLVADICRDLGLSPDWSELAQEAWAVEEIRSGEVGAALRGLTPPSPPPQAGEVAQETGGGIPPPLSSEPPI